MGDLPADPRLRVETSQTPRGTEVRLTGELDAHTRGAFVAAVDSGHRDVDLDASGVTFVDSSGLAALVIAADRVSHDGRALRLVAMSHAVRSLLTRTGLLEHLAGDGDDA